MTGVRRVARAGGSLFDVDRLQGLGQGPCNLLVVSDTTLYMLERFALNEVNFLARYVEEYVGPDSYVPVDGLSDNADFVRDVARIFRVEVSDVACDIVGAINALTAAMTAMSCGCPVGQGEDTEDGERGGTVPSPIGDVVFTEPAPVTDRDCKSANLVHQTLLDVMTQLDDYNVDDMSVLGLAFVVSLVTGVIASAVATPLVGVLVAVAGAISVFAARLLGITLSLANIVSVMSSEEQDLVCDLFGATTAGVARSRYVATLIAGGATTAEAGLVELLMTNALLDTLFFDVDGLEDYLTTYVAPVSCALCLPAFATWVISDSGVFGLDRIGGGVLGIGTVDNDGGEFTMDSVPITDNGWHAIAIQIDPLGSLGGLPDWEGGDIDRTDGPTGGWVGGTNGARSLGCGTSWDINPAWEAGLGPVYGGSLGVGIIAYLQEDPFSCDFIIDPKAQSCG